VNKTKEKFKAYNPLLTYIALQELKEWLNKKLLMYRTICRAWPRTCASASAHSQQIGFLWSSSIPQNLIKSQIIHKPFRYFRNNRQLPIVLHYLLLPYIPRWTQLFKVFLFQKLLAVFPFRSCKAWEFYND